MFVDDADYFSLLGLNRVFNLDANQLEQAWKRVALAVHPDRFATATPVERRVAMQWSARANEAYRILRHPLSRARYLCELGGFNLQTETNTAMSADFLLRQMQWHELLEQINESKDELAKSALESELKEALETLIAECGSLLDAGAFADAGSKVREWMFLEKILSQLRVATLGN
jgi:molecular chaperone HscB